MNIANYERENIYDPQDEVSMGRLDTIFSLIANTVRKIQSIDYDRKVRTISVEWVPVDRDATIGKYDVMPNVTVVLEKKWFVKKEWKDAGKN